MRFIRKGLHLYSECFSIITQTNIPHRSIFRIKRNLSLTTSFTNIIMVYEDSRARISHILPSRHMFHMISSHSSGDDVIRSTHEHAPKCSMPSTTSLHISFTLLNSYHPIEYVQYCGMIGVCFTNSFFRYAVFG